MTSYPKKKRGPAKLTAAKVQPFFNHAIVAAERFSVLSGSKDSLQCSHFFPVGGNGSLRFYPPNAHAMTAGEHIHFHNRDVLPYTEWMQEHVPELEWMKRAKGKTIKYTQSLLAYILGASKRGEVALIESVIKELLNKD